MSHIYSSTQTTANLSSTTEINQEEKEKGKGKGKGKAHSLHAHAWYRNKICTTVNACELQPKKPFFCPIELLTARA